MNVLLPMILSLAMVGPDTCLAPGQERPMALMIDSSGFPAGIIGYQVFIEFDPGLLPTRTVETTTCDPAWCCNFCNGASCRMSPRLDLRPRVYAVCYAGSGCARCGEPCDGGHGLIELARWWTQADATHSWAPGVNLRHVRVFFEGVPTDEGVWTCCAGLTEVPCDGCGGMCHRPEQTWDVQELDQAVCAGSSGVADPVPTWGYVKSVWR